jgi:hypothetical protein
MFAAAAGVSLLVGLMACERDMTIALTKKTNPPSFKLDGSGRLFFFSVSEVSPGKPSSADDPPIWEIRPTSEDRISSLPEITYGVVPPGFTQTVPKTATPAPLLRESYTRRVDQAWKQMVERFVLLLKMVMP